MSPFPKGTTTAGVHLQHLLGYIADLELEVDRLRRHNRLVQQEMRGGLGRIRAQCAADPAEKGQSLVEITHAADSLIELLRDLQDLPGYHPSHDQVVAIAVRPLAEQVFRWQQRLVGTPEVLLRLELATEHVEWFPARLMHILDNLLANALKYRDPDKAEPWVSLALEARPDGYEFRVRDNGLGMPPEDRDGVLELFYRAAPARAAGLGVGLAVVKMLAAQSGGSLTIDSGEGQGTTFVLRLPRYDLDDYLV